MANTLKGLVYRPGSLGDTVVSLPAIAEIRRRFPQHRLSLLTESPLDGSTRVSPWTILRESGWFDEVFFYTVRPAFLADRWRNFALAMQLRRAGFDDIFSLAPPRTPRQLRVDSIIFRGVVGSERFHGAQRAAWPPSTDSTHGEHEGLRLLRIVDRAATEETLSDFRLTVPDSELAVGRHVLNDLGVRDGQILIGVAPGSARSATAWPAERFAVLGRALLGQFRNLVLLAIGGARERQLCEDLCAAWGERSHNLAGRLSVFGSASVLSRCAAFIGNDSGPTHLAAVLGVPCVAIFSARNAPGQWQPIGRHHVVLEERPECAGCMLDDCVREAKKCLMRIETGRVVREAISLIESRRSFLAH